VVFVPSFYVVMQRIEEWRKRGGDSKARPAAAIPQPSNVAD